jgi:hypothetical protein
VSVGLSSFLQIFVYYFRYSSVTLRYWEHVLRKARSSRWDLKLFIAGFRKANLGLPPFTDISLPQLFSFLFSSLLASLFNPQRYPTVLHITVFCSGHDDLFSQRGEISEIVGVLVPRIYSHIIMVSLNAFVFHIMLLFSFILTADVGTDCHSYHIHDYAP